MSLLDASLAFAALLIGLTGAWSPCGFSMVETIGLSGEAGRRWTIRAACATFLPGAAAGGIATFGAPLLLAVSTDATGSYNLALYLTAGLMLLSAIIPLIVRPPKPTWKAEVGAQEEIAE